MFISIISAIPMINGLTMQDNKSACLSELESQSSWEVRVLSFVLVVLIAYVLFDEARDILSTFARNWNA